MTFKKRVGQVKLNYFNDFYIVIDVYWKITFKLNNTVYHQKLIFLKKKNTEICHAWT